VITLAIKYLIYFALHIYCNDNLSRVRVASISKRPIIYRIGRAISDVHIRWINCIMARRWSNFPLVRNPPNSRVWPAVNCETIIEFEDAGTRGVLPDVAISLIFLKPLSSYFHYVYIDVLDAPCEIFPQFLSLMKGNKYIVYFSFEKVPGHKKIKSAA